MDRTDSYASTSEVYNEKDTDNRTSSSGKNIYRSGKQNDRAIIRHLYRSDIKIFTSTNSEIKRDDRVDEGIHIPKSKDLSDTTFTQDFSGDRDSKYEILRSPIPKQIQRVEGWRPEWGPKPIDCLNADDHFKYWRSIYEEYIEELYNIFCHLLKSYKVIIDFNIDYEDFVEFVYFNSSGYIPKYLHI